MRTSSLAIPLSILATAGSLYVLFRGLVFLILACMALYAPAYEQEQAAESLDCQGQEYTPIGFNIDDSEDRKR